MLPGAAHFYRPEWFLQRLVWYGSVVYDVFLGTWEAMPNIPIWCAR